MADELDPRDGEEPLEDGGEAEIVPHGAREPWEKRESETSLAYQAFAIYRDMGPGRSSGGKFGGGGVREVARRLGKDVTRLFKWSSAHDWVERVEAYDLEMDRRYREAREAESVRIAKRQAAEGAALQLLGMERVRGNPAKQIEPMSAAELTPADAARFIDLGVQVERLAMGMPTNLVRGAVQITLPEFQDAMRKVIALAIEHMPESRRGPFLSAIEGLS